MKARAASGFLNPFSCSGCRISCSLSPGRPVHFQAHGSAEPAVSVSEPQDDRIELVLKGGSVLRVGRGFDAVTLGRLLDVVERRS
jgi:transposase